MTSMKVVHIPVIENFANLIVYPSEQKVTIKQNKTKHKFIYSLLLGRKCTLSPQWSVL